MKVFKYHTVLNNDFIPYLVHEDNGKYIVDKRKLFNTPSIIKDFCVTQLNMDCLAEEYCYCFCLDSKCKLIGFFEVSHGTIEASLVSPRELFQKVLLLGGKQIVIAHNHPSGDCTPSQEDFSVTEKIDNGCKLLDLHLVDHIIIGRDCYYSMEENK